MADKDIDRELGTDEYTESDPEPHWYREDASDFEEEQEFDEAEEPQIERPAGTSTANTLKRERAPSEDGDEPLGRKRHYAGSLAKQPIKIEMSLLEPESGLTAEESARAK